MKRFYIPTSSLNFNNILSTETISPKDFYQERDFGYSRWISIKENDIPSVILLYETPYIFERPQSDSEDHPLLIEYASEKEYPVATNGVYYTDKTIYLDPGHTRFIFFTQHDKDVALSLSDSSLETKMLRLYQRQIVVDTSTILKGTYPIVDESKINVSINIEQIEYDRKVNKMKGLLYGYYIGAYLSMNDEQLLNNTNTLREISNIFSSVISSLDKTPSITQEERLAALFASLHKRDPIYKGLINIIGDEGKTDEIIMFLEERHCRIFPISWRDFVYEIKNSKGDNCSAIMWVESELNKQNKISEDKRTPLSVDEEEIITIDLQLTSIKKNVIENETLMAIYKAWVNDILSTNEYNGRISSQRAQLSDTLTVKARDILSDKWEDSQIRTFMNQLRQHIRGGEFTQLWDNNVLSSIASCLIKGDDWEPLLLFMQSKGMTDYRLAFSFYGVLNGFANLTRDFTDLLLNLDKKYVWEVYREFAGQLLGLEIKDACEVEEENSNIVPSTIETNDKCDLLDKIKDLFSGKRQSKSKDKEARLNSLKQAFQRKEETDTTWDLLLKLLESPEWTTKGRKPNGEWKKLALSLCQNDYEAWKKNGNKTSSQQMPEGSFDFDEGSNYEDRKNKNLHFYNDPSTIIELRDIIGENKVENVQWFFEDFKKPRNERTYYKQVEESNDKWVIDSFCKSDKIRKKVGDDKLLEEIRAHFYKKYGIR